MKHVDRTLPFGGNQHEVDFAPGFRHRAAHTVQQAERVFRDDFHDGKPPRRLVVAVHDWREYWQPPAERAFLASFEPYGEIGLAPDHVLQHLDQLRIATLFHL